MSQVAHLRTALATQLSRRKLWIVLGVFTMNIVVAEPASTQTDLEQGVLDLQWGTPLAEIREVYPGAREIPQVSQLVVVAPAGFWGVRSAMGDLFVLSVDSGEGLTSADFQVAAKDVRPLLTKLNSRLGPGRSAVVKTMFGNFSHTHEWSTSKFGVRLAFATLDGTPKSPAFELGLVHLQRGPLAESAVEKLDKSTRDVGKLPQRQPAGPEQ